jgi:hypothetical protein
LEESVELSPKESKAKIAEQHFKEKVQPPSIDDSPVENLRDAFNRRKDATSH